MYQDITTDTLNTAPVHRQDTDPVVVSESTDRTAEHHEEPVSAESKDERPSAVDKTEKANETTDTVTMSENTDTVTFVEQTTVVEVPAAPPEWMSGLEPVERPGHAGHDQGVVTIIVLLLLGMAVSFNNLKRIWGSLTKKLWSTRIRDDYEESTTGAEKRTIGLLLLQSVIFIAVICTAGLSIAYPLDFDITLRTTLKIGALITTYFVFQYVAYWVVGFTFASPDGRKLWIQGFTAAMILLGIALLIPGLAVLFYPGVALQAVQLAALLYIFARIMFISKGFRIFYTNFGSLIYFILYLCSLEIIPLFILFFFARTFCALN